MQVNLFFEAIQFSFTGSIGKNLRCWWHPLGNDQTFRLLHQGDIRAGNNNEKDWNKTGIYWNEK